MSIEEKSFVYSFIYYNLSVAKYCELHNPTADK